MKIVHLKIENFRGVRHASLLFPDHVALVGDNNTGKTTVLEAMDLVLGPDRMGRRPVVDEHDFYLGEYLKDDSENGAPNEQPAVIMAAADPVQDQPIDEALAELAKLLQEDQPGDEVDAPTIRIEVTIVALTDEQQARFGDYIEWWDTKTNVLYDTPNPEGIDADKIVAALRVTFVGRYDPDEDDFEGNTYFTRSITESDAPQSFTKKDKQKCGFLYLRSLRTGSRALSLEHGSLLDIILRLKEIRPQMWEDTIAELSSFDVASDPELGISGILQSIEKSLKKYVPKEWGVKPHLKVSALTREHLRKVITAFVATGEGEHAAPFYRQGAGTINMLVLAMLSQIAEDKQNVIFAMEEPETAIPPYAQKRIIHEIRKLSSQSFFASHSPYVLEEFDLGETVILSRSNDGNLTQATIALPQSVKHKRYRQEFRTRFCEGLLARRVLIAEGATEAACIPTSARRLAELDPEKYRSLEALGVCTIDAGSETQIADLAALYRSLGKSVFAICDKQAKENEDAISAQVEELFMHDEKGTENMVLKSTTEDALKRFAGQLEWPPHLKQKYPDPTANLVAAISDYFGWSKGNWGIADFLAQCNEDEIPEWIRKMCVRLKELCEPAQTSAASHENGDAAKSA